MLETTIKKISKDILPEVLCKKVIEWQKDGWKIESVDPSVHTLSILLVRGEVEPAPKVEVVPKKVAPPKKTKPDKLERLLVFDGVAKRIARRHCVSKEDLLSKDRFRHLVEARKELYKELRDKGLTLSEIGNLVGRDHTTVLNALND